MVRNFPVFWEGERVQMLRSFKFVAQICREPDREKMFCRLRATKSNKVIAKINQVALSEREELDGIWHCVFLVSELDLSKPGPASIFSMLGKFFLPTLDLNLSCERVGGCATRTTRYQRVFCVFDA